MMMAMQGADQHIRSSWGSVFCLRTLHMETRGTESATFNSAAPNYKAEIIFLMCLLYLFLGVCTRL